MCEITRAAGDKGIQPLHAKEFFNFWTL